MGWRRRAAAARCQYYRAVITRDSIIRNRIDDSSSLSYNCSLPDAQCKYYGNQDYDSFTHEHHNLSLLRHPSCSLSFTHSQPCPGLIRGLIFVAIQVAVGWLTCTPTLARPSQARGNVLFSITLSLCSRLRESAVKRRTIPTCYHGDHCCPCACMHYVYRHSVRCSHCILPHRSGPSWYCTVIVPPHASINTDFIFVWSFAVIVT